MRLFVTGGAGFIGSNFIRHVLSLPANFSVVNFDKLTYAGNLSSLESLGQNSAYRFIKGDICDPVAVEAGMDACDAVVHFAAESHVDRSIYEPAIAIDTNLTGTFILLEVARKMGIRRFLQVSTDEVYGDIAPGTFTEEDSPLRPSSPYAASKAGADLLVASFVRTYGFPAIITRSSNNYGPFQFPEKFLPLMIANALEDKQLAIYGDGRQEREWLHVEDNCRGILEVLLRGRVGEVYNIGGLDVMENLCLARRLLGLLGKPESLLSFVSDRPGHDRRYGMTSRKIKNELGWKPEISLDAGLRQTIEWYKNNGNWLAAVRGGDYRTYYNDYYINRDASLYALAGSSLEPSRS